MNFPAAAPTVELITLLLKMEISVTLKLLTITSMGMVTESDGSRGVVVVEDVVDGGGGVGDPI